MIAKAARNRDRRGLTIIPALVCLVLVTVLSGVLIRQVRLRREVGRAEERRMQAEWLSESGAARAAARLGSDRYYKGESWEVPAEALGGHAAVVTIAVEPLATTTDRPGARTSVRVRVATEYPKGDERQVRTTKTLTLDTGVETPGGPK